MFAECTARESIVQSSLRVMLKRFAVILSIADGSGIVNWFKSWDGGSLLRTLSEFNG